MRPNRRDDVGHGGADRRVVPYVRLEGGALRPEGAALGGEPGQVLARPERVARVGERAGHVERRDPGSLRGQRQRRRAALPVRRAGDEGDLAREPCHHRTSALGDVSPRARNGSR